MRIKNKVLLEQSKYIKQLKNRADTSQIVGLINLKNFQPILADVKGELKGDSTQIKQCVHDSIKYAQDVKALSVENEQKFDDYAEKVNKTIEMHD